MGRYKPEVIDHNQALLELIAGVAESKNTTSAQVILAWELAQKPFIIPRLGTTTKLHRLEENLGAANIQQTKEKLARINDALSKIDIDETHF
jgi:aryl-alcohol dehydrogenase-like predicted oxidoreductase